jgi:hypothetical protein
MAKSDKYGEPELEAPLQSGIEVGNRNVEMALSRFTSAACRLFPDVDNEESVGMGDVKVLLQRLLKLIPKSQVSQYADIADMIHEASVATGSSMGVYPEQRALMVATKHAFAKRTADQSEAKSDAISTPATHAAHSLRHH